MTTASEIQAFREEHQCSLFEAKDHFKRKDLIERLEKAALTAGNLAVIEIVKVVRELIDEVLPEKFGRPRSGYR